MSAVEDPIFLSLDQVLHIHLRVVEEFGGDSGLRDPALLESALGMPSAQFGGAFLHGSVAAMAGAQLFHLCKNHPFLDGNKRTALAAAEVFLLLNGLELVATNEEVYALTMGAAEGRHSKQEVVEFFEERVGDTLR